MNRDGFSREAHSLLSNGVGKQFPAFFICNALQMRYKFSILAKKKIGNPFIYKDSRLKGEVPGAPFIY